MARLILEKLYGNDSKSNQMTIARVWELAAKEFPAATKRGIEKVSTGWHLDKAVYERDIHKIASQYHIDTTTAHTWLQNFYFSGQPFLSRMSFKAPIIAHAVSYLFNTFYATIDKPGTIKWICEDYINSTPFKPYVIKIRPKFFNHSSSKFEESVKNGEKPKAIAEKFNQNLKDVKRWIAVFNKRRQSQRK